VRACWVTHRRSGLDVMPTRCTRRVSNSMKNRMNTRRRNTVSTVTKSHARMPDAWARKNSFQLKPARLGAGSIPSRRRISHTVLGAIAIPRPLSSPWIRR
jgi:hypothetical protein